MALALPRPSLRTILTLAVVGALAVGAAGLHRHRQHGPTLPATASAPNVADFDGFGDIHFGDDTATLTLRHGLQAGTGRCGLRFTDQSQVSPVFVDGRLVLLWLNPPVHTPEGVLVGSSMTQVRSTYPDAVQLAAAGPHRSPGLLVSHQDRAYLLLYANGRVTGLLVGYAKQVSRASSAGALPC